ncbi:MAG: AbrB/MazE/SpoVT family DNA-binding domain-containing protein [Mycobacterium sp.]
MRKKVVTIGTSAGVTLSRDELAALGVAVGDSVDVTTRDGVVEIRPVNPFASMSHEDRVALLDRFGARP